MGRDCGYLALMSGLATGAEQVYLPRKASRSQDSRRTSTTCGRASPQGSRLGLADPQVNTPNSTTRPSSWHRSSRGKGGGLFDVRTVNLGHVQQGGAPSPFDRIAATRLATAGVEHLIERALADDPTAAMVGLRHGEIVVTPLAEFPDLVQRDVQRASEPPWWMALRPVVDVLAHTQNTQATTEPAPSRFGSVSPE